jgi:hypothetical protein
MKHIPQIVCFVFAQFCLLTPVRHYAQAALQEIVRFELPGVAQGISQSDPGGDVNGDGRPDLVFGYWIIGDVDAEIYIYHSIPDSIAVPDQILTPPPGISGGFGYSLAYAGDLNGDGIDDLVVGIQYYGWIHQGAIAIYWGGATLSAQPDVFIDGYPFGYTQSWDLCFGQKLISHCDINGDGINDLLVYAEGPQYENWGNVYVFLGGTPFSTTPALHIRGNNIYEYLGRFMDSGDINGDGFDDIIVCSQRRTPPPPEEMEGYVYDLKIYAGGANLSNVPVYDEQVGSDASASGISSMAVNGDLNGDGFSDITMAYGTAVEGDMLKVIYGQDVWSGLTSIEFDLSISSDWTYFFSYCNLNADPYSDLMLFSRHNDGLSNHYLNLYMLEQTSPELDLSIDYFNSFQGEIRSIPWHELGDLNNDGYNEFVVWNLNSDSPSYAQILSQRYTAIDDNVLPAQEYRMDCYPNPFNGDMTISLTKDAGKQKILDIKIFDVKGRLIFNVDLPGIDSFMWNGIDRMGNPVSSGVYILQATDSSNKKHLARIVRMK